MFVRCTQRVVYIASAWENTDSIVRSLYDWEFDIQPQNIGG